MKRSWYILYNTEEISGRPGQESQLAGISKQNVETTWQSAAVRLSKLSWWMLCRMNVTKMSTYWTLYFVHRLVSGICFRRESCENRVKGKNKKQTRKFLCKLAYVIHYRLNLIFQYRALIIFLSFLKMYGNELFAIISFSNSTAMHVHFLVNNIISLYGFCFFSLCIRFFVIYTFVCASRDLIGIWGVKPQKFSLNCRNAKKIYWHENCER